MTSKMEYMWEYGFHLFYLLAHFSLEEERMDDKIIFIVGISVTIIFLIGAYTYGRIKFEKLDQGEG